ncbi:DNA excision repair protein [Trichinella spiralis]|uniref:DNA excision repair protein n=1 Tax=Trichinella spiralis TaxID=6334 RepID=A0ABR3K5U3_TRISP
MELRTAGSGALWRMANLVQEWRSITNRCLSLSLSLPEFDSRCLLATCWTKQAFLTGDLNLALCHSISRRARPLGDAAFDDGVMVLIIKRLL